MINPLHQYNYGGMPLTGVPGTITTPLPGYPMYNFPPAMPQHDWSTLLGSTAISPMGSSFSSAPSSATPQSASSITSFSGLPSSISALPPAPSAQVPTFTTGAQGAAQPTYTLPSYQTQASHHPPPTTITTTSVTTPPAQPPTPDSLSSSRPVPLPTRLPASPPVTDGKSAMEGVVLTSPQPAAAPTPARSPSPVKVLTVEEEIQLLVNGTGEISDMQAFAKLVSSQTEWESRAKVLAPLNTAADSKNLQSFRRQQGLKLVTKLLLQSKDQLEDAAAASVAIVALQILLKMPVSLDELKEVKTGKVVKHFATAAAGDKGSEIHEAAKKVMDSWQALVASASAKESASPTDEAQDKANERKRDRDSAEQDAAAATSSKRVKADDAVKRENSAASDKRKAAAPLTPPAAVADMDIFKSLAHTSLPKIKKVDPKVLEEATKPALEAKATSPITTEKSRTATVGTFALPAAGTIPSYRKDPSATTLSPASASASASASSAPAKRRVRFAEGDKLLSIRIFETDQGGQDSDSFNTVPHMLGNARDFDRQEGKRAFRKDVYQAKAWTPPPLINAPQTYEWGKNSIEDKIQEERERTMLGVAYYSENQIPPSATEPIEPATPPPHPPKPIRWDPPAPAPAAPAFAPLSTPLAGGLDLNSISSLLGMLQSNNAQANPQQSLLAALQQPAAAQTPQQQPNIASLLSKLTQQPQLNLASLLGAAAGATPKAQPNQFQQLGGQHRHSPPGQQHQNQQQNPHQQQYNQQQQQPYRQNLPFHMQQQQQQQTRTQGSPDNTATAGTNTRSRWGPPSNATVNNNSNNENLTPGGFPPGGFPQQHNAQAPYQQHQQTQQQQQYNHHQRGASHNNRGGGRGGFGGGAGRPGPYDRPQQGVQMAPGSMDRPCNNFVATGMCRWGDRCAFRHDVKQ
ncbi:hypothetical protein HDU87_000034 [Geranomyces variabilis]|uniref:C3H1-type domain-containing protein n=1 Tax=Geranomyces variabilis TaxID=109894 RepID=A0AAD5TRM0_9FUNG|nr:hypothetical protein HDU87_000034 [Geranomyces variabilis]